MQHFIENFTGYFILTIFGIAAIVAAVKGSGYRFSKSPMAEKVKR